MTEKKFSNPFQATWNGIKNLYGSRKGFILGPERLDGKKVLITGSSSGLGLATAKELATRGANLIMAVRSGIPDKGNEVKEASGSSDVTMYHVDLSDFKSIDQLVGKLVEDGVQVDLFISNAAMVPSRSRKTPQGLEEMFMVNYLAPFYLTNQLLAKGIIKSEVREFPRIIFVSSESHRDPDDFQWDKFGVYEEYGMKATVARYGYFKLLLNTFAMELSRRLNAEEVTIPVRSLCPGPVNTNIARESPGFLMPVLKLVFAIFFRSPEKACAPVIHFATQPISKDRTMDYFYLMNRKEMDEKVYSESSGKKLWELSQQLVHESV